MRPTSPAPPGSEGLATPTVRAPLSEQDWRVLITRYSGALHRSLRRRVASASDVEDLVQQALLQALTHWPAFRGESRVSTWVFGIAHNLARHHASHPDARLHAGLCDTVDTALCPHPGPSERLALRDAIHLVQTGLDALPAQQAEALWLVGVDGLSYREAATSLGTSTAAVKNRVARARATLRAGVA